ncbi:MAG: PDR/VanB family oxidoreductase [Gordonia sp. (in: high G+C Gram-positive bacteria)]
MTAAAATGAVPASGGEQLDLTLTVTAITAAAQGIRTITLANADGSLLPGFVPGSHLVVHIGGHANAYSLVSDGTAPTEYRISVLLVGNGRGGSRCLHRDVTTGDELRVSTPRSAFAPIARARKHLLIAGGIGITPIVSHLRAARRWGRETQVLYTFRPRNAAHLDDVRELTDGAAELFTCRTDFMTRLRVVLRSQPIGTHLYVCGPAGMIDDVLAAAVAVGWPPSRRHSERFGADVLDPGEPFRVRLTGTDRILDVDSGISLLDVLEQNGISVPNQCRQGVCGECRLDVCAGVPRHRDLFLSEQEKADGTAIMACVSRAQEGTTLEVSL